MAQYKSGNCTLTSGNTTVVGASCDWFTASAVKVGDLFKKRYENAFYSITSIPLATNLTISPAYAGSNASNVKYEITRDFTPYLLLPEIGMGDVDFHDSYTRAVRKLDDVIASRLVRTYKISSGSGRTLRAIGMTSTPYTVKVANATAGVTGAGRVAAVGFIKVDNTTSVDVVFSGPLPGYKNLRTGYRYYLKPTSTATNITSTLVTAASHLVQLVGYAESATSLLVKIGDYTINP